MTSLNQENIALNFISNIIDTVNHPHIINYYWNGKTIKFEELLNSSVVKLNCLFSYLWNAVFDTYPSKKDFEDFITGYVNKGNDKWFLENITFDYNLLNHFVSQRFMTLLRYGVLGVNMEEFRTMYDNCVLQLNSRKFIETMLIKKWKHRFNMYFNHNETDTLLKTFLKLYIKSEYSKHESINSKDKKIVKSISGYTPDAISITDLDTQYMSLDEIQQYIMHRDQRFILQLTTHNIVVYNSSKSVLPQSCFETITSVSKKHTMLLNIVDDNNNEKVNKDFWYNITLPYFRHIPKLCNKVLHVVSSIEAVPFHTICRAPKDNNLLYIANTEINLSNCIQNVVKLKEMYGLIMSSSKDFVSPQNSIYYLPFNRDYVGAIFKVYITYKCPYQHPSLSNNIVLYVSFLSLYIDTHYVDMTDILKNVEIKEHECKNTVVLVDNRFNWLSVLSCIISMYNLWKNKMYWKLKIYTNTSNVDKYKNTLDKYFQNYVKVEKLDELDCELFHLETYNTIMKNPQFWNKLKQEKVEKCLIIQDDGVLVNGKTFETYMHYDYVGAPWVDQPDNLYIRKHINPEMVGNGGFSLRDVAKMQEVCQTFEKEKHDLFFFDINEIPEDIYFVKYLLKIGANVPPKHIAKHFAIEQEPYEDDVCGFHKFWNYHRCNDVQNIFEKLLQK